MPQSSVIPHLPWVSENLLESVEISRSHAMASSSEPVWQCPVTGAMTGCDRFSRSSRVSAWKCREGAVSLDRIAYRLLPAEKDHHAPRRITQAVSSDWALIISKCPRNSINRFGRSAFSASGRFNVRLAISSSSALSSRTLTGVSFVF